jgi:CBS domain-containing protein
MGGLAILVGGVWFHAISLEDTQKRLIGIVSLPKIKNLFIMDGLENLVPACDLMADVLAVTVPEARLTEALEKMKEMDMEVLPVVSNDKDHQLVGMIEQRRIRQALGREIIRRNREET